jgi:hypothetical protein
MSEEKLGPVRGPTALPYGADRSLSADEVGGIQLVEDRARAVA